MVTGGTDGIGAATALELAARGADVTIIGGSQTKADALLARAAPLPGSLQAITADFSLMSTAQRVAVQVAEELREIDLNSSPQPTPSPTERSEEGGRTAALPPRFGARSESIVNNRANH